MKYFKQVIIYLSILSIITVAIFATSPLKSYAEVPASQKAVVHDGAWGGYPFDYSLLGKYWTIEDSTGIPQSTYLTAQYFYTDDNITFYALQGKELYTAILNRGCGIVASSGYLDLLYQSFMQIVGSVTDTTNLAYLQGALYDSNNHFLGYCVNDITGCYYQQPLPADTPAVDVPNELTNDIYNHYKYYEDNNTTAPDYFTFYPASSTYIKNNYWTSPNRYFNKSYVDSTIDSLSNNNDNLLFLEYYTTLQPTGYTYQAQNNATFYKLGNIYFDNNNNGSYASIFETVLVNDNYFINNSGASDDNFTYWNAFCNFYGINQDNKELLFTDVIDYEIPTDTLQFQFKIYDSALTEQTTFTQNYIYSNNNNTLGGQLQTNDNYSVNTFNFGYQKNTANSYYTFLSGKNRTFYKSRAIFNSINVNKDYEPDNYKSSIYYNYNNEDDHSFTINYTYIDNSETNNETIYNEGTDVFYDEVDKGEPSIGAPPIEITIIIENIIPEPSEDPDPEPNPDPDEPNLEDDTILNAILNALKRFFDVIGKLLGTVLAGLLEMIDAILESIAGIMENLTGLTEFISALFSWIPSPVPQVLAIGFSLCILAAIIKFIRG